MGFIQGDTRSLDYSSYRYCALFAGLGSVQTRDQPPLLLEFGFSVEWLEADYGARYKN